MSNGRRTSAVVGLAVLVFFAHSSVSQANQVLVLHGTGDYAEVPITNPGTTDLCLPYRAPVTFSAWFKFQSLPVDQAVLVGFHDAYTLSYLGTGNSRIQLQFQGSGGTFQTPTNNFVQNYWYHYAFIYDGTNGFSYINGSLVTNSANYGRRWPGVTNLFIGCSSESASGYWNGSIDEVTIWGKMISSQELTNCMSGNLVGNESGLVSWWSFNDGTASDSSTNTHDGVLRGTATIEVDDFDMTGHDSDRDGVSNEWTLQHFGHLTGQAGDQSLAGDDPDGDGYTNLEEYQNGGNPKVFDIGSTYVWTAIEVGWKTVSGTNYQVQTTTDLVSNNWVNLGSNIVGNGAINTILDSTRTNAHKFYRVVVP
jgi:hypothetical protein